MIERALVEYAINALWQVPLLAASAWLLLWMIKPAPVTHHRVWLALLGLAVLLPLHRMRTGGATRHTGTVIEATRDEALVPPAQSDLPRTPGQRFAIFKSKCSSIWRSSTGNISIHPIRR